MKQTFFILILILALSFTVFAQTSENSCPKFSISTINELARENETVFFIAEVSKEILEYDVKYNWSAQNLKIVEGQGIRIIRTLRNSDEVGIITLEITGLPANCGSILSESLPLIDFEFADKVDEFGKIPNGDLRARLDNFLVTLQNNPSAEGLIIVSDNQKSIDLIRLYNNHFGFRNFDQKRISFLLTNEIINQTQFFIIPKGAVIPTFKNSLIIKSEEFDRLNNLFQPKPIVKKRKK